MDQFVNFPTQLDIDDLLELAQARHLSVALDMVYKSIDAISAWVEVDDEA